MSNINLTGIAYTPFAFGEDGQSSNGKQIWTGVMLWSAATQYTLDPTQNNQLLEVQGIQTIFYRNTSTTKTVLTISGTNQTLDLPESSDGYLSILAGDRPIFTFQNASGNGSTDVHILNKPISSLTWSAL